MSNMPYYDQPEPGLHAPSRAILLLTFAFLGIVVIAGIGVVIYLTSGRRIGAVLPFAAIAAVIAPIVIILVALVFRRDLPRLLWLWLSIGFGLIAIIGAVAGIGFYRSGLPPRYQEEIREQLPFMAMFLPPTPVGGLIPTVAATTSGLTALDLLAMPIGMTATPDPAALGAVASTVEPTQQPSPTPTATSTEPPTQTPSPTPSPTISPATPAPTQVSIAPTMAATVAPTAPPTSSAPFSRPAAARMYGFRHEQQGWNNCGPTNVTMALSFFGWQEDQDYAAQYLRPDNEDKNVSPHEMVDFVNQQTQVRALYRIGGTLELLRYFIAANFPVIVELSYTPEGYDWIGHYQTVVGYDDTISAFSIYDSYLGTGENGEGITEDYASFDQNWQAFNRVFIVLYRPQDESLVNQILGDYADTANSAETALGTAQAEARANPQNTFAWFNMGSSLVELGRYDEAATAYDQARRLGVPFRINWYQFGMFEAYYNVGRYDDVLALVQTNLTNGAQYVEETYYWQGRVLEAQGDRAGATAAYQRALNHNPRYEAAQLALDSLST